MWVQITLIIYFVVILVGNMDYTSELTILILYRSFTHHVYEKCIIQMYYPNVLSNCIIQLYYPNVLSTCGTEGYIKINQEPFFNPFFLSRFKMDTNGSNSMWIEKVFNSKFNWYQSNMIPDYFKAFFKLWLNQLDITFDLFQSKSKSTKIKQLTLK